MTAPSPPERPTIGLYLPPDGPTLARIAPALAACGHLEVLPEGLWARRGFNGFLAAALRLQDQLGVPLVSHSVGLCTTTSHPADAERQRRYLDRLAETHAALGFAWMTDHSGATTLAGEAVIVPVGVPLTDRSLAVLRARLDDLRGICGAAGVENSALYAWLDPPEAEPGFLAAAVGDAHGWLLDLHNLAVMEANTGYSAEAWLDAAPLDRVIELHLAGGSGSDGLPVGRRFQLDSHDARVPDRVWQLLDAVIHRVPGLRGVTLERLEGTVEDADVPGLVDDLGRARDAVQRWTATPGPPRPAPPALPAATDADHEAVDALFARALRSADPAEVLAGGVHALVGPVRAATERALADPDALRLVALLVAQQRFSRLVRADPAAMAAFDEDPAGFTARFRAFHLTVAPGDGDPWADARRERAFIAHG